MANKPFFEQLNVGKQVGIAAVLTALFTFLINYQQQSRLDFNSMYDRQEKQITRLENRVSELEQENDKLYAQVASLSSLSYENPLPTWMKDLNGYMVTLNRSYEETFLRPNGKDRYDYIGKSDSMFWGVEMKRPKLAASYRKADLKVLKERQTIRSIEYGYLNGKEVELIVYKYPIWSEGADWNGKHVIGVGGVAVIKN